MAIIADDPEAHSFLEELSGTLRDAGWNWISWTRSRNAPLAFSYTSPGFPTIGQIPVAAVVIATPENPSEGLMAAARVLSQALLDDGFSNGEIVTAPAEWYLDGTDGCMSLLAKNRVEGPAPPRSFRSLGAGNPAYGVCAIIPRLPPRVAPVRLMGQGFGVERQSPALLPRRRSNQPDRRPHG
jgi:hypothetical protein